MRFTPTQEEINIVADCLVNDYNISQQRLDDLFGKTDLKETCLLINVIKASNSVKRLEQAKLMLHKKGTELLSCSTLKGKEKETVIDFRKFLLRIVDDEKIKKLYQVHEKSGSLKNASYMITVLAEKSWFSGGPWANAFVKAIGFPEIFAGVKINKDYYKARYLDIQPFLQLPQLEPFQEDVKKRMLQVLKEEGDATRCVVSLPTGGGKTRVAVETFIEWMQPRFSEQKYLIWIAQSEELCEQAISCVEQLWSSKPFPETLRVYRFFGREHIQEEDLKGGVVVCSIQKIYSKITNADPILEEIIKNIGAIIIDECHRAVSMMYNNFLDRIEELNGGFPPICGLSATPGRAGIADIPTLVERFQRNLITPNLGQEYDENPLLYFQEKGYLSKTKHIIYRSGREYLLTEKELKECPKENDDRLGSIFLKRLSNDKERNILIIKRLREIDISESTIVFACTVEHANFLSMVMNTLGRSSGVISSETSPTVRRGLINDFKTGELKFLFNFGVLATGFDAPKINNVVICRPTTSQILYEQIIGRGVRGLKFGGTEKCTIIDFADNISILGPSLAYLRFKNYWTKEEVEYN